MKFKEVQRHKHTYVRKKKEKGGKESKNIDTIKVDVHRKRKQK